MIITFFSNYYNHHQAALCRCLSEIQDVEFYFVETEPMESFRKEMGWGNISRPDYVISAYENEEKKDLALHLSQVSDAVIVGSAPEWYVEKRIQRNDLTFRYTERPMKEGWIKMFIPRLGLKFYRIHYKNRDKNLYLLGASAFAAADYAILHSYPGKCLKFGYFPEGEKLSMEELSGIKKKEGPLSILWTGRFLKLKRADLLIKALKILSDKGLEFTATLVGDGPEKDRIKALASSYKLDDRVTFSDFVKPDEVRQMMRRSDIYVMTSNHLEGWGSVIYEALSEGCAVAASHACGCTNWLVKPGETGMVFKSGDHVSLADKLERFITDDDLMRRCQRGAKEQMEKLWNPEVAAGRIAEFTRRYKAGEAVFIYEDGPLSRAGILKNNWFND